MFFEQRDPNPMTMNNNSLNPIPEEFRTLFLGDLSIHCTRQDVLQLFHPYGTIERITLKVGASMKGLGYGFISFSDRESAERAMNWLQGSILLGRALRISWATPRGQTHLVNKESPKVTQQTAEVHFSFLTKQTHFTVTEAIVRKQYEQFGVITDVVIKRTKMNPKLAFQNGYGFVRYALNAEGIQAAINATKYMHQVQIDGINYDTHLTHALETLLERMSPEILREHKISSRDRGPMMNTSDDYMIPMMVDYAPPAFPFPRPTGAGSQALPQQLQLQLQQAPPQSFQAHPRYQQQQPQQFRSGSVSYYNNNHANKNYHHHQQHYQPQQQLQHQYQPQQQGFSMPRPFLSAVPPPAIESLDFSYGGGSSIATSTTDFSSSTYTITPPASASAVGSLVNGKAAEALSEVAAFTASLYPGSSAESKYSSGSGNSTNGAFVGLSEAEMVPEELLQPAALPAQALGEVVFALPVEQTEQMM